MSKPNFCAHCLCFDGAHANNCIALTAENERLNAVIASHGESIFERATRVDEMRVRIAALEAELRDTTWQDHADYWQKRAIAAESALEARDRLLKRWLVYVTAEYPINYREALVNDTGQLLEGGKE